ncbi:MAG: penicillin-binding protein 2 [Gammaproteobacteria bacterium]|nr:penicillin-binding protein 2 [Gammaproteobacteria bacterium]
MPASIYLADRQYEQRVFQFRALIVALICLFLLLVLAVRMIYLQVVHHDMFSTLSQNNRLQVIPTPPNRGLIFDRNGVVLAENQPAFHLEITPEDVVDMEKTLSGLVEVVNVRPTDIESFKDALKRRRKFESIPLRLNLSERETALFAVNRHRFPGVDIAARLSRHYPFAETTAHVLGYVGRIDEEDLINLDQANYRGTNHIGKLGVEQAYEDILHGNVGYQQLEVNVEGRELRILEEQAPVPGDDLQLHLDIRLQQIAEQSMTEKTGAVIAMDPNNGAILALVSRPSFDPHPFVNGISKKDYQALRDSPVQPLFNRALRGQYPPGSTIKPALALAALELGADIAHETVNCKGFFKLPTDDRKYRDWKKHGHGKVDLHTAIVQSCDVYFYNLANQMGIDAVSEFLGLFGLGQPTGIDVAGEKPGLLPSREWKRKRYAMPWFPGETISVGIGQGYMLMTPMQLVQMSAALATAKIYQPQLVAALLPKNAEAVPITPVLKSELKVTNLANWDEVRLAMRDVVHTDRGTARGSSWGTKYEFAGKTGTAQVIGIAQDEEYDEETIAEHFRDHALFIAFSPVENPRLAVAVLVEHGGHGSSAAAPVARQLFDAYMKYYDVQ